ncbi:thiamine/thiamine pyrophosphate ABC transporter, permease protein [Mesorhizobium sp. L-8-10]|nr:thiamine/thiamine pyrophosphate ABC transporter, permease protein [Mesorhizobium sp. L-8-10]
MRDIAVTPHTRRRTDARVAAGATALAAIGVLVGGAFAGLAMEGAADPSGAISAFDPYMARVVRFTLWQALLSTLLSVAPAMSVARALSRHPVFPGRGWLVGLFAVPLGLPAIVAALGILALLGRAGYVSGLFTLLGADGWPGIYGLAGILIAHVFFNLPLATRLFLEALDTVPPDQWRLASQLGMGATASFRLIEWPVLRASLPGVAGLVFMLCITSFTLVLTLGGGPGATTLEVAIYQALRFDFDPARAAALTMLQIALAMAVVALLARIGAPSASDTGLPVSRPRLVAAGAAETVLNAMLIVLAALLVVSPMAATVIGGLEADLLRLVGEASVRKAATTSLAFAFLSALISVTTALSLVSARRALELGRRRGERPSLLERLADTGAGFVLVVPPLVVGAGWFILLRHIGDVLLFAPVMVVSVNAVMAMPFAVRAIRPAYDAASERHERLCAQLGLAGWIRLRLVELPVLRRPLLTGFAFAMALSLGDLGVIALFGSDAVQTLPYLLYQRLGSYRTADAAGLALLLGGLCLVLMLAADRLGRKPA